ncbi:hypothetical protein ACA910_006989 [Epithemia clementina (nom. ined.)]
MEVKRSMRQAREMRIDFPLQAFARGPFPIRYTFGMALAIMSLRRSLDRERNSNTIQWDTMRGVRSAISNFIHSTPNGTDGATMTDGKKQSFITRSSTNSRWFKRFMDGTHEWMGDVKVQDMALTIDVLIGLQELLEECWRQAQGDNNRNLLFEIATVGAVVTTGFSSALRGEELGHIRLQESILWTTQGLQHPQKKHVVLALEGRFKGQVAWKKHKIPLVCTTASGIKNQQWLVRLMERCEAPGVTFGPLFRVNADSRPASIKHLDIAFHKYMLLLQLQNPNLIPETTDVVN